MEKKIKNGKINNKNLGHSGVFIVYFGHISNLFLVGFEQVNVSWENSLIMSNIFYYVLGQQFPG